jgi:hypothetical protein
MRNVTSKTNRQKVEKAIIAALRSKISDAYIVPTKADIKKTSLMGRFYTFSREIEDAIFHLRFRFFGQHSLRLQADLCVSNRNVEDFLRRNGFPETEIPNVISFDIEKFFIRAHPDPVELQGSGTLDEIDVEKVAERIHNRYFKFVDSDCIPKMSTVESLHDTLNADDQFLENDCLDLYYLWPMQPRILVGVALALMLQRNNSGDVLMRYHKIITTRYKRGDYPMIDFCTALLQKHGIQ